MNQVETNSEQLREESPQWPSAVLGTLSLLGVFVSGMIALSFLALASVDVISGSGTIQENAGLYLSAASFFFIGVILFPSFLLSVRRLTGRSAELPARVTNLGRSLQTMSPFLFLPLLAIGALASQSTGFALLLLPVVHLVLVGIIAGWLILLATRTINAVSTQLSWAALNSGLVFSPLLAFGAEIFVGLFFLLSAAFYLGVQPGLLQELESFMNQAAQNPQDIEALLPAIGLLLSDPILLILVLAFVALAVPIIEELVKPAIVWLLFRQELSPADGFVLGVLSGAGFALFENLTLGATVDSWLSIFVARIGTSAMHMFTSGLMGWAIVSAKIQKRYAILLGSFALSVALHGLWNSMAILGGLASLGTLSGSTFLPAHLIISSSLVLLILAFGSIILLRKSNQRLQLDRSEIADSQNKLTTKDK